MSARGLAGVHDFGFIAQELQEFLPEAVGQNDDGTLMVNYGNLTSVLVEAIKELDRKVEQLSRAA